MGLPISPAPLTMSPTILVRHLICPQLVGPAVHVCLSSPCLLTHSQPRPWERSGQESTPAAAANVGMGPDLGLSSFRRLVRCLSSVGACCDLVTLCPPHLAPVSGSGATFLKSHSSPPTLRAYLGESSQIPKKRVFLYMKEWEPNNL
jgi:hypothetical protein